MPSYKVKINNVDVISCFVVCSHKRLLETSKVKTKWNALHETQLLRNDQRMNKWKNFVVHYSLRHLRVYVIEHRPGT